MSCFSPICCRIDKRSYQIARKVRNYVFNSCAYQFDARPVIGIIPQIFRVKIWCYIIDSPIRTFAVIPSPCLDFGSKFMLLVVCWDIGSREDKVTTVIPYSTAWAETQNVQPICGNPISFHYRTQISSLMSATH